MWNYLKLFFHFHAILQVFGWENCKKIVKFRKSHLSIAVHNSVLSPGRDIIGHWVNHNFSTRHKEAAALSQSRIELWTFTGFLTELAGWSLRLLGELPGINISLRTPHSRTSLTVLHEAWPWRRPQRSVSIAATKIVHSDRHRHMPTAHIHKHSSRRRRGVSR